jgi:hypothetical protein
VEKVAAGVTDKTAGGADTEGSSRADCIQQWNKKHISHLHVNISRQTTFTSKKSRAIKFNNKFSSVLHFSFHKSGSVG